MVFLNSIIVRFLVISLLCIVVSCASPTSEVSKEDPRTHGPAMVVSTHPLASEIGAQVLRDGGNAIDAMVATHFALAVVYPDAGNVAGGGFMIFAKEDSVYALDFREMAPAAAFKEMYLDENGNVIDGASLNTSLASGVPGSVDGMLKSHDVFGSMPLSRLLQPSIDLARNGFALTEHEAEKLMNYQDAFESRNEFCPFLTDEPWTAGDSIFLPELAHTLELIRDHGRAGFYEGETAEEIVDLMHERNGIITLDDLANYSSIWRKPVTGTYKDLQIYSMPPPSSGGIVLLQMLAMLEKQWHDSLKENRIALYHQLTEIERRAYADRAEHLGDADFYQVPLSALLDDSYIEQRASSIDPKIPTASTQVHAGSFMSESEETTHYSIIDKDGNAVSVTTTLNGRYGSKIFVEAGGFFLNNEMDDFSVKPGVPNQFGLIGNEANAIEAGKRPLSSMTPTIAFENGELYMILGSPGGSMIITSVMQVLLNVYELNMTMQEAVNAPRYHHQWLPDEIKYESNHYDPTLIEGLEKKGHVVIGRSNIGRVNAILIENGEITGGADPRGDDTAIRVK